MSTDKEYGRHTEQRILPHSEAYAICILDHLTYLGWVEEHEKSDVEITEYTGRGVENVYVAYFVGDSAAGNDDKDCIFDCSTLDEVLAFEDDPEAEMKFANDEYSAQACLRAYGIHPYDVAYHEGEELE